MKVLIAVLGFALLAQFASAYPGNQIDLPKTCTDVLSADTCKKIEEFAVKLKLDSKEVLAIIQKVVNEGVTDANELYAKVVAYIGKLSCAKVLGTDNCKKIAEYAAKLKLNADELMVVIKKAVESGTTDAKELYAKIVKYMSQLTCEKALGADNCKKIAEYAAKLKLNAEELMVVIKKAVESGTTDAKELYAKIVKYMNQLTCEKALGADTCKKIAEYAAKLKLNADELMVVIQKAVESGTTDAKELYAKIVKYMSQLTCEKALGADTCKKIAEYAAKLKLSTEELMVVFEKAVESGITEAKELYTEIVKYMSELTCAKVLGTDRCERLQKFADLLSLNFDKVVLKLKEYYEKGVTSATELYRKLVAYIKGSILGDEAEPEHQEKRGIVDVYKFLVLKRNINKFVVKLRNLAEMTKEDLSKIQANLNALIKSKELLKIVLYISDLADKYFPKLQSDAVPMELDFKSNDMPTEVSLNDFKCSVALKLILSEEFCKNIEDMAAKLQLSYDEVLEIIENAKDVISDAKKMYEEIFKYMNELSCAKILGADKCNRLEKLADLFSFEFNAVVLKLKELYESGVTSVLDLYKKVVEWITGIFGAELEGQGLVGFTDALKEKLMEKLNAVIEKLKKLSGVTADVIKQLQEKIEELLESGRVRTIANYIKDLFEKYFPQ